MLQLSPYLKIGCKFQLIRLIDSLCSTVVESMMQEFGVAIVQETLITQLNEEKRKVDVDTFDITVRELVNMVDESFIDIAPEYQRQFRWDEERQSTLIESILLGIPIPSMFMAANSDGTWELVDGVQRISTIVRFIGDEKVREKMSSQKFRDSLRLTGLETLQSFNGYTFEKLPQSIRFQLLLKPLKITTITDKSDLDVRFSLFERLNRGGITLSAQEIRSCIYRGGFNELLKELSDRQSFKTLVYLPETRQSDGTKEEWILRFFAYFHNYKNFEHSVREFLNNYMEEATKKFNYPENIAIFDKVFETLADALPDGLNRSKREQTPANLYEAVTVGAALAYQQKNIIVANHIKEWLDSEDLYELTARSTNTKSKVIGRIEFCRNKFLGQ